MTQKPSSIPPKPPGLEAPLSLAQQRLWFIYQYNPQSPEYNISRAWRLRGRLNKTALGTSLNLILARHEALRTTFLENHETLVQIIQTVSPTPIAELDFSSCSPTVLESEIHRVVYEEPLQPFNLSSGPPIRFTLLRCGPEDHVFLFTVHHMVFDGTSLKVFCQELNQYYQASLHGKPAPISPLPIQYQDYAYWQQSQSTDEKLASQLVFWKQQLQGASLVLDFPSDRVRTKDNLGSGGYLTFTLASHVTAQLKQRIQPQGMTMFMALLTVFQILVFRYTGQKDILVGTPIAGRTRTDLEDLIGFFVNTLVLRTQIVGQQTFHEILRQVRKTCLEAYRHQELPFEKLVEILKPVRDPSRSPIVQTIFQLRQASDLRLVFPEVEITPFPVKRRTGNFDLHMVCEESESGIQGYLYYSQELYSASMMARFVKHYEILLEALVSNPQQPIDRIEFLTEIETHQQLVDWNDATTDYSAESCVPQLFEAQVARTPDAIAVVYEAEQLTYTQLNQRANQLAHYLQQQSVGLEVRVGVCLERDLDLIVSLLAILKAGGVYVPLDPSYPPERLTYMLTDAKAMVVLTSEAIHEKLGPYSGHVLTLEWTMLLDESSENLPSWTAPANLVYVLYTSGSTGRPKGVMIAEASAVAFLHWAKSVFSYEDLAGVLAATSICFDLSVFELFVPLSWGGTVVLAENALQLPEILEIDRVTLINTVPSVIGALLDKVLPPSVRTVNLAGEPLKTEMVKAIDRAWGVAAVYDLYGPSETTTYATYAVRSQMGPATIGRALGTTTVFLLDQYGQLVPVGVPGELTIGGVQVARGYLHRPALTAEKFGPNSFNATPGTVVYQTGDRARYLADGTLEFLGRIDHQIKLRGYRIELGEIEALLSQHAAVQEAVVLCREDSSLAEKYLVAYVTKTQDKLEVPELRAYLQKRLPNYMIPATFVTIEQFPLTPNGKIDRKALPGHTAEDRTQGVTYVAPHTLLEELVAEVWQQVLNIERIGIHDNFFELGGHSLLATRVIARLRQVLELSAPLRTIFEHPTIAEFAMAIDSQLDATCPDSSRDKSIG